MFWLLRQHIVGRIEITGGQLQEVVHVACDKQDRLRCTALQ
jgi:hypothetical protein